MGLELVGLPLLDDLTCLVSVASQKAHVTDYQCMPGKAVMELQVLIS